MKSIENIFNIRLQNPKLNTSYPLYPSDWEKYRVVENLLFAKNKELSFYIHIPFCRNLCTFCEYTRMKYPDEGVQNYYLDVIASDIHKFISKHPDIVLRGFDIGGGTPTCLSEANFDRLIKIYQKVVSSLQISQDFESSIEGSFQTLSEKKLQLISRAGINRISLGVQTSNRFVLSANKRSNTSMKIMYKWIKYAKSVGIHKINLDLMYGLKEQSVEEIKFDLALIALLKPEQITLYELRTNMLADVNYISKEELFLFYNSFYNGLTSMSYHARFGQNTFSIDNSDYGVSSYMRSRMLEGLCYKGFGLSAQSMSKFGISYNIGKNSISLLDNIKRSTYNEEFTYQLPKIELLSKYIAISAYCGRFSLNIASDIINENCIQYFKQQIDFCIDQELMTLESNTLFITRKGYKNYGAVFSLFYLL
jgi:oxygen-independent coproporphyrinogen-3 oxidase